MSHDMTPLLFDSFEVKIKMTDGNELKIHPTENGQISKSNYIMIKKNKKRKTRLLKRLGIDDGMGNS